MLHWKILQKPSLLLSVVVLAAVVLCALGAPIFSHPDPMDIVATPNLWPFEDPDYLLGSDILGRDMWSGIAHGARNSLAIGIQAGVIAALFGLAIGCLSGYFGGWIDHVLMRFTELFQIMPSLIFTIIVVVILSPTPTHIIFGIACTTWPNIARLVRSETIKLRHADFIHAAQVIGMSDWRILVTHVVPHVISTVLVTVSILIGNAILIEAALAFLGLGDPNVVSWGSMIGAGREALRTSWYMTALPGLAIFITVFALNAIGNGLNDIFNPRTAKTS